jgi:hypothetical protein
MRCEYCNKRLSIIQRLKGQTYCSVEHQELHFSMGFERLRESLSDFTPDKPVPKLWDSKPASSAEPGKAGQAIPVQPQAKLEPLPAEPEAVSQLATPEASPTLEIASLVEAVGTSTGVDLPEAPFLPELPLRQDQPAIPLITYAAELVSATVQLPASLTQEPPLRGMPTLTLDVSPAQPPAKAAPAASPATWRTVPPGYPPVVVSATATLLLDANGARLIPLPVGEPCPGAGPVPPPLPRAAAIETPLGQPRLFPRQADRPPASSVFVPPPQAPACEPPWEKQPGSAPALPPPTGILRPQRDVERLIPIFKPANFGALASFQLFAALPAAPVAPKEIPIAPDVYFAAAIAFRRSMISGKPTRTTQALVLPKAASPLALESTPARSVPGEVQTAWQPIAVACQLPQTSGPASRLMGLSLDAKPVPLRCSSATSFPPPFETGPAVSSPIPFLLLSRRPSHAAPALPLGSSTLPLWREACRLPIGVSERQFTQSMAHLHPSVPSPLSLVTWSQSLSISIPARNPSNLGGPAAIRWSANQGRAHTVRLSPPSWRGHRVTPLRPLPSGIPWAPVAPTQASLRPPVMEPIRPGAQGTVPPRLNTVRAQPASMPVLPPAAAPCEMEPVSGLAVFGPASEEILKLACIDMAYRPAGDWEPCAESSAVLPPLIARRQAPPMGPALSSHRIWWDAVPPVQAIGPVEPFSALQRLAWSLTAGLPSGGHPAQRCASWLTDARSEVRS